MASLFNQLNCRSGSSSSPRAGKGDPTIRRTSGSIRRGSCPTLLTPGNQTESESILLARITNLIAEVLDFGAMSSVIVDNSIAVQPHGDSALVHPHDDNNDDVNDVHERKALSRLDPVDDEHGSDEEGSTMSGDQEDAHDTPEATTSRPRRKAQSLIVASTNAQLQRARQSHSITNEERFLRHKLAEVLLELTREKENLQMAASAGNALLGHLGAARAEQTKLRDRLDAQEVELEDAKRENARLKEICAAMEGELRQYDSAWSALEKKQTTISRGGSLGEELTVASSNQRRSSSPPLLNGGAAAASSRSSSSASGDCTSCIRTQSELDEIVKENDTLKRRCVELELQHERVQNGWSELSTLHKKNEGCLKRVQNDYTKALADIDYMTTQLKLLKDDHCQLITTRDNLRAINHRLKSDNEVLTTKLVESGKTIETLEAEKRTSAMQLHVLEHRSASLQSENERLTALVDRMQTRLQIQNTQAIETAAVQRHAHDLEQLLAETNKQLTETRYDNQLLVRRLLQLTVPEPTTNLPSMTPATIVSAADLLSLSAGADAVENRDVPMVNAPLAEPSQPTPPRRRSSSAPVRTSLVYHRPSIARRHQYVVPDAPIRSKRGQQRRERRNSRNSSVGDEEIDVEADDCLDHETTAPTMSAPLYLGLSLLACATAVRYIIKR